VQLPFVPDSIVKRSSLTSRQVELLSIHRQVQVGDSTTLDALSKANEGRTKRGKQHQLTRGSFERSVRQGKDNVSRALVTLLVASWMGLVKQEDLRRLIALAEADVSGMPDTSWDRLGGVLESILERVVL
jgi:hypothetical protein